MSISSREELDIEAKNVALFKLKVRVSNERNLLRRN